MTNRATWNSLEHPAIDDVVRDDDDDDDDDDCDCGSSRGTGTTTTGSSGWTAEVGRSPTQRNSESDAARLTSGGQFAAPFDMRLAKRLPRYHWLRGEGANTGGNECR